MAVFGRYHMGGGYGRIGVYREQPLSAAAIPAHTATILSLISGYASYRLGPVFHSPRVAASIV